jgi:hypothetical protein
MNRTWIERIASRSGLLCVLAVTTLFLAAASPVTAAGDHSEPILQVGDQAPHFSVATSQDTLVDYDRDYYGSHHLLLTFFPAAFTPV